MSLPGYTEKSTQTIQPHKKEKENQPYPSAPIIYKARKKYAKHNHPQRRCLKKQERILFNRSEEIFISRQIRPISSKHSEKTKKSRQIGKAQDTLEPHQTGITDGYKCICHCQDTPKKHSKNSTTQKRKRKPTTPKRTHHIRGPKIICNTTICSAAA